MSLKFDTYRFGGEVFRRVDKRRATKLIKEGFDFFLVGSATKPNEFHGIHNLASKVMNIREFNSLEDVEAFKTEFEEEQRNREGKYAVFYVNFPLSML